VEHDRTHDRTAPELSEWWRLSDAELALLETKALRTRLGFTVQLTTYWQTGHYVVRIDKPSMRSDEK
jgi:hypothetical protein